MKIQFEMLHLPGRGTFPIIYEGVSEKFGSMLIYHYLNHIITQEIVLVVIHHPFDLKHS